MPHARRITALVVNLLLVHVMWVGSGFACSMPAMDHGSSAMPGMAAMDTSGTAMANMDMSAANEPSSDAPDHEPCKLPWAPDGCRSMTPCAPLAMASLPQALQSSDDTPLAIASQLALTPPSQVRAPELPPPRA